jgi:hypothetical protein
MADIFDGLELNADQQRELATLRRGYAMLNQVIDDPDIRAPLRRKLNEKNPDLRLPIPEDIAEPLLAPIRAELETVKTNHAETLTKIEEGKTALQTIIDEFKQGQKDAADVGDLRNKIEAAARHYRFTDEGKQELVKHMQATSTSDPMTAGAYLVQNMEKPAPMSESGLAPAQARVNGAPDVDLFHLATGQTDDDLKLLHSGQRGQDKWFANEVNKILAEGAEAA